MSPLPKGTEVLFLIDSSSDVTPADFQLQKLFVKTLFFHFNISQTQSRGAAVIYAADPYAIAGFSDVGFSSKVERARLLGTPRRIDKALEYGALLFKTSGRKGPKIIVLLTAGKSSVGSKPLKEAIRPLRNIGVQTFVVSLGEGSRSRDHVSLVDTPDDVYEVLDTGNLPIRAQPIAKEIRDKSSKL